jgi:Signal transduction histidine kinase
MFVQGPASGSQRNNGLGVGLSVARRLVELHGGSVRAISDGKTGSEFVVDLPLVRDRPRRSDQCAAGTGRRTPAANSDY